MTKIRCKICGYHFEIKGDELPADYRLKKIDRTWKDIKYEWWPDLKIIKVKVLENGDKTAVATCTTCQKLSTPSP